ncbi:YfhO family protein [Paludibaculum fermentans]|uniref:YfhO family protein n=1 Tax=Paludibaculum fermentans TaxID=1473598 RepID=A0A7S7SJ55_PALFE|nr:YfhO family protein [Paludibaculum fermentans]QOY86348.1 YfhO family protein [Paludibaculum fermentans]
MTGSSIRLRRILVALVLLLAPLLFFSRALFTRTAIIPYDLPGYHVPQAGYFARSLAEGRLPLWDPYSYCGMPFAANLQTQVFYPPNWPFAAINALLHENNVHDVLEWLIALHMALAGWLAYLLCRRLRLGWSAALFGGVSYQLGAFFASQAQHQGAVSAAAWMPLAWAMVFALAERFSWRRLAVLALSVAMIVLAGFPAVLMMAIASAGVLAVGLFLLRGASWRLPPQVIMGGVWGAALSAIQLVPAKELIDWSTAHQRTDFSDIGGGGIPPTAFGALVWPNWNGVFDFSTYHLPWNPTFAYFYCGLAGALLACASLWWWRAARWQIVLLTGTLAALFMMGGHTPFMRFVYPRLPRIIRSSLYDEFGLCVLSLSLAVLAAFGFQAILARRTWQTRAVVISIAVLDLWWAGAGRPMNKGDIGDALRTSAREFEGSRSVVTRVRDLTTAQSPPWRIDAIDSTQMWGNAAPMLGIYSASGNEPLASERVLAVRRIFGEAHEWERYIPVKTPASPLLDMLSLRYLIAWNDSKSELLRSPAIHKVDSVDGHAIWENDDALPRFTINGNVYRTSNLAESIERLRSPEFHPAREVVLETTGALPDFQPEARGTVQVLAYQPESLSLAVETDRPALMVSSEAFYPGWHAKVDGRPVPLLMVNAAFRGVAVGPGKHQVEMTYAPASFRIGLAVTAVALLLALLALRRPA